MRRRIVLSVVLFLSLVGCGSNQVVADDQHDPACGIGTSPVEGCGDAGVDAAAQ